MGESLRINISLPKSVLEDIQQLVAPRKRNEFIAEATKEKLALLKQQKALGKTAGAWKDKNHPHLNTAKDMEVFLKETRGSYKKRLERYDHE